MSKNKCKLFTNEKIYYLNEEQYTELRRCIDNDIKFFTFEKDDKEILLNTNTIERVEIYKEEQFIKKENGSIYDVISYILHISPDKSIQQMKLHKLLFYIEGWGLPQGYHFFDDEIKASINGPIFENLINFIFKITEDTYPKGNINNLSKNEKGFIQQCFDAFKDDSGAVMSVMACQEGVIKDARKNCKSIERVNLDRELIKEYFQDRINDTEDKKRQEV